MLTVKQGERTVYGDSGAYRLTFSSLTMEVEAVTPAILWLASPHDTQITHAIILTDYKNLLQKWRLGSAAPTDTQACAIFGCKDYCGSTALAKPESEGMNGQIKLASTAEINLVRSLEE